MKKPVCFDRTTTIDVVGRADAVNRSVRVSMQTYRSKESSDFFLVFLPSGRQPHFLATSCATSQKLAERRFPNGGFG
jgi:hypothetical protein